MAMLALCLIALVHGLPTYEGVLAVKRLDDNGITLSTNLPATTSYVSIPSLQKVTPTQSPSITGSVVTALPSMDFTRDPVQGPEVTGTPEPLQPIGSTLSPGPTGPLEIAAENIFAPMSQDAPPAQIQPRDDHPVKKQMIADQDVSLQTNKFYANFFLGSQTAPVWTHPYSLSWAKGYGGTYGMSISHVERDQLVFAPNDPPEYFIAPIGIQHIVLSATELGETSVLSTEELTGFSVYANLAPSADSDPVMSFPCVQGMGFITALYNKAQPDLSSGVFFQKIQYVGQVNGITYKYRVALLDGSKWLLYVTPIASLGAPPFYLLDSTTLKGPEGFTGMIQVAKNPADGPGEEIYDYTAGTYAVNATVSGTTNGPSGTYTIKWGKQGLEGQNLLMFALPHHIESFDDTTKFAMADIQLATTTKGYAQAVIADSITMVEPNLPDTLGFAPWVPASDGGSGGSESILLDQNTLVMVNSVGATELNQDFDRQTRLDSMYYSGKGLAKYAAVVYTLQTLGKNSELAAAGLLKLKDAFHVFVNNTQPLPLVYDNVWGGVVSSGTYKDGNTGQDFGNTLYNDHHFHYGYFVWTAAVIGYLDPEWLGEGTNKAWVNMLVRDYANPSDSDPYFPFQRAFDWYHGHSWAKGLFESFDGKDQESTSEDTFSTYAIKMWGRISGDANMEARGNLQLAVQARSVQNYFLLTSDNKVQPEQFLPNKVTGILFENKVDHTTYFGANIEYIQGIHMIPLNPSSAYVRTRKFVQEEWDAYFSQGRADQASDGWKGILYANLALNDPITAYEYFANPNFSISSLDGGASRTWYLAYTAAMMAGGGGAPVVTEEETYGTSPSEAEDESEDADYKSDVQDEPASAEFPGEDDESSNENVPDETEPDRPSWYPPGWYGNEDEDEDPVELAPPEESIWGGQDGNEEPPTEEIPNEPTPLDTSTLGEQDQNQDPTTEATNFWVWNEHDKNLENPAEDAGTDSLSQNQDQDDEYQEEPSNETSSEDRYQEPDVETVETEPVSLYECQQDACSQGESQETPVESTPIESPPTDDQTQDDEESAAPETDKSVQEGPQDGVWNPGEEDFIWPQPKNKEPLSDEEPEVNNNDLREYPDYSDGDDDSRTKRTLNSFVRR